MGRAARWNFFIENFVKAYEMAAGVVGQLKAAPPAPPAEHAKLGVVLAKAMRAKQVRWPTVLRPRAVSALFAGFHRC